jgi:hypothetical protein
MIAGGQLVNTIHAKKHNMLGVLCQTHAQPSELV